MNKFEKLYFNKALKQGSTDSHNAQESEYSPNLKVYAYNP